MKGLHDFISEDTNQFGPGTDLIVSLLSVLLVMTFTTAYLYNQERMKNDAWRKTEAGSNFRLASDFFTAADFYVRPVTKLVDPARTNERVRKILAEYERIENEYPYMFIIGHSNQLDDPSSSDKSESARRQRNWEYAARRATKIASLMEQDLDPAHKERLVVVTTGEFDLKEPRHPFSQANAWVEVVFAKEWKRPERITTE